MYVPVQMHRSSSRRRALEGADLLASHPLVLTFSNSVPTGFHRWRSSEGYRQMIYKGFVLEAAEAHQGREKRTGNKMIMRGK